MALATSQLRSHYSPACTGKGDRYHGAYASLNTCLHHHGYQPRRGVTGAYNCRKITGGSGYSLHAYGPGGAFTFWTGVSIATSLAVDINWDENPYGPRLVTDMPRAMIDDITAIRTNSGAQVWRWGGYYRTNKDAMHFEIVCSPADLATGIDPRTLPGADQEEPFTMAQFDEIMTKLNEIEHEATVRQERIIDLLEGLPSDVNASLISRGLIAQDATKRGGAIGELRRNVREIAAAVGAEAEK